MKKNWRKGLAVITAAALVITTAVLPGGASAKGKVKLNKKKVTMKVGKRESLALLLPDSPKSTSALPLF